MSTDTATPTATEWLGAILNGFDQLAESQAAPAFAAWLASNPDKKEVGEVLDWIDTFTRGLDELRGEVARRLGTYVDTNGAKPFINGAVAAFNGKMAAFNGEPST